MHHIVLWKWAPHDAARERATYTAEHVNIVAGMIKANLHDMPYRIVCVTDDPAGITECETHPLWPHGDGMMNASGDHLPSCYRRLRLFDPAAQWEMGIPKGDRIVSIDLDVLVTGELGELLETPGLFVGWELKGTHHDRVLNGSFQMFTAGELAFLWKSFNPSTSPALAYRAGYMGSDQAWLSYHLAGHLDREVQGRKWPQISSYALQNQIQGLFEANRLVFFHGQQKPWQDATQARTPWIKRFWRLPQ